MCTSPVSCRNSFAHPDFFLQLDWVLAQLHSRGSLEYSAADKDALLKADLRCHRCGSMLPNMPRLRDHIKSCTAPLQQ